MARSMYSPAIVPSHRGKRPPAGKRSLPKTAPEPIVDGRRGSKRAVLGKTDVESQSFHIEAYGTRIEVTVRYIPPRHVGGNQWPLALVELEVSNMAACLNDVDATAAKISHAFGKCSDLNLSRWDVGQWLLVHSGSQVPKSRQVGTPLAGIPAAARLRPGRVCDMSVPSALHRPVGQGCLPAKGGPTCQPPLLHGGIKILALW